MPESITTSGMPALTARVAAGTSAFGWLGARTIASAVATLEGDRILRPDLELGMAPLFSERRLLARRDAHHLDEDAAPNFGDAFRAVEHRAGVHVEIVAHLLEDLRIRRDLEHRRDRVADGRAPAGREGDDIGARRHEAGRRVLVVAGALHHIEAVRRRRVRVLNDTVDRREA